MSNTTQEHLSIADIKDDIVILKDGGGALVLQTSAVNFGLLSEQEQIAIISAFAQMLNSLSFTIQIVIRSERLNINSYIQLLNQAQKIQTNPLLAQMMRTYSDFILSTIKENEVLDKSFYIVIPLFKLELGLSSSLETLQRKITTILLPRRDQVIRQLSRIGLKATQLTGDKLLKLFFEIYNRPDNGPVSLPTEPVKLNTPQPITKSTPAANPPAQPTVAPTTPTQPVTSEDNRPKTHPFVVEELI